MRTTNDPPYGHENPLTADPPIMSAVPAGNATANGHGTPTAELLTLTVQHPTIGVCVVTVAGEIDALTVALLNTCIRAQLTADPTHLILDLQAVRFMGSAGLTCLLEARELTQQTVGAQLHLAGLVTRAVARPLQITELLPLFDTHATLTHALTALVT